MLLFFSEKRIHSTFKVSIILKGIYAVLEIITALLVFLTTKDRVLSFVDFLTQEEITQDPKDYIANFLLHLAKNFSIAGQHFVAIYLLIHGIIKLVIVRGLFKKEPWAYPSALVIFSVFIFYEVYRYDFTHSFWLLPLIAFDILIVVLTYFEYSFIQKKQK